MHNEHVGQALPLGACGRGGRGGAGHGAPVAAAAAAPAASASPPEACRAPSRARARRACPRGAAYCRPWPAGPPPPPPLPRGAPRARRRAPRSTCLREERGQPSPGGARQGRLPRPPHASWLPSRRSGVRRRRPVLPARRARRQRELAPAVGGRRLHRRRFPRRPRHAAADVAADAATTAVTAATAAAADADTAAAAATAAETAAAAAAAADGMHSGLGMRRGAEPRPLGGGRAAHALAKGMRLPLGGRAREREHARAPRHRGARRPCCLPPSGSCGGLRRTLQRRCSRLLRLGGRAAAPGLVAARGASRGGTVPLGWRRRGRLPLKRRAGPSHLRPGRLRSGGVAQRVRPMANRRRVQLDGLHVRHGFRNRPGLVEAQRSFLGDLRGAEGPTRALASRRVKHGRQASRPKRSTPRASCRPATRRQTGGHK